MSLSSAGTAAVGYSMIAELFAVRAEVADPRKLGR
jgi:hypothetical protein